MAQTCQHCGARTDDDNRVMCPNCGRRMQARDSSQAAAPPPMEAAPPPPMPAAPPPQPYIAGQPAYAPYATAQSAWPTQVGPAAIEVTYNRAAISRTSRLTVLFRLILAIPHLIALWAVSYAAAAVTIVAWFAALFTAQVPAGMYGFIGWVVRYGARVTAYLWLLTDRWPSFTEGPEDPVQVQLPGPERLNRAAVLFRLILLIPAALLGSLLSYGLAIAAFFVWLIVLVRGAVPQPVFDGTASAVRYHTRFYGYASLLTARYPGGLYGDPGVPSETPPAADEPAPPVMNRGARRMIVLLIVLGALGFVGQIAASAALGNDAHKRQVADDRLAEAYQSIQLSNASTCLGASDPLGCATDSAKQNAAELRTFNQDLDSIDFPAGTGDEVDAVRHAADQFISDYDQLSQVTSLQDYRSALASTGLASDGRALDEAVRQLSDDLANNTA